MYAAQMLLGSARLVLESGQHPGALKDAVCSPGGSTIQGVRVLEERGFRGAVTDAVLAAYDKTREMGKGDAPRRGMRETKCVSLSRSAPAPWPMRADG